MSEEFNKSFTGKVIERNNQDISITVELCSKRHRPPDGRPAIIHLSHWLLQQDRRELPHTNAVLHIENVKFVHASSEGDQFIADANTKLRLWLNDRCNPKLDQLLSVDTLMRLEAATNCRKDMLGIVDEYSLTVQHLEQYLQLPNRLLGIQLDSLKIALFELLLAADTMDRSNASPCNAVIYTPTSVQRVDHNAPLAARRNTIDFGNRPSAHNECLVGFFGSRLGSFQLRDEHASIALLVNCTESSDLLQFSNAIVFISKFHSLSETYPDGRQEAVVVDVHDMYFWAKAPTESEDVRIVDRTDDLPRTSHRYDAVTFDLLSVAPVSAVHNKDELEVWLKIRRHYPTGEVCLLSLSAPYLSTMSFLDVGRTYTLHSPDALSLAGYNPEVQRLKLGKCYKLTSLNGYFEAGTSAGQRILTMTKWPMQSETANLRAFIGDHYLTPQTSSRSALQPFVMRRHAVGLLGKQFDHRLNVTLDGQTFPMYLNNWESKLPPLGVHPNVLALISNVKFTGRYFLSNIFTDVRVIAVSSELKTYASANLSGNQQPIAYASLSVALAFKYDLHIRTRVHVHYIDAQWFSATSSFRGKLEVSDDKARYTIEFEDYRFLFKLMGIVDGDTTKHYLRLTERPCREVFHQFQQDNECSAFEQLWLRHCTLKLNAGIRTLDVLCRRAAGKYWCLADVYAVNCE